MKGGDKIKRFKNLNENNIKNNDIIMLYIYDIEQLHKFDNLIFNKLINNFKKK